MAEELNKTAQVNIRLSPVQKGWLAAAAQAVSRERGEIVDEAVLARELILAGVEPILARGKALA